MPAFRKIVRLPVVAAGVAALLAAALGPAACTSTTIAVKEGLGFAKREQLVDAVKDTRNEQDDAKEQFATTLEQLKALSNFDGGKLESQYTKLKREYDRSVGAAKDVKSRINQTDAVAKALFNEWQAELGQYQSAELRAASEGQLRETRGRYEQLITVMRSAEQRMDPVLRAFGDQVLFLKHNLNARAIASLDTTFKGIEADIDRLIAEMNASIAEADEFIKTLDS